MDNNTSAYSPLPQQPPTPYPPPQQDGYNSPQQQPFVSYQQGGGYNPQQQQYIPQQPYSPQQPYAQPYTPQQQQYTPQQQQYTPQQQQQYIPQQQHPFVQPPQQGGYNVQPVYALQNPATGYQATTVVVTGNYDDAPFVPISEPGCTQLGNTPRYLLAAVTRPRVSTYDSLKLNASWLIVFFLLFVQTALSTILAVIEYSTWTNEFVVKEAWYYSVGFQVGYTLCSVPIFFFLRNGLFYILTRALGRIRSELFSHPKYMQLCYVSLLVSVPLNIIGFTKLIPFVGAYIGIAISVYSLVLWILGLRGVFHVSTGQAIAVIIFYVLILVAIFVTILFVFSAALLAALSGY